LLPHSTYFIRQFLVLVLFVGYCFGEIVYIIMCIIIIIIITALFGCSVA